MDELWQNGVMSQKGGTMSGFSNSKLPKHVKSTILFLKNLKTAGLQIRQSKLRISGLLQPASASLGIIWQVVSGPARTHEFFIRKTSTMVLWTSFKRPCHQSSELKPSQTIHTSLKHSILRFSGKTETFVYTKLPIWGCWFWLEAGVANCRHNILLHFP